MNNIVSFKSCAKYFVKERDWLKPNTVRFVDMSDARFILLAQMVHTQVFGEIEIVENSGFRPERFIRKITDVTFFNGNCIISWQPAEVIEP